MSNAKHNGTSFNVSNKPGVNGVPEGDSWENVGNLFLDSTGRRGTLYLNLSAATLERWLAAAKAAPEGQLSKKVSVFQRKPKAAPAAS